MTWSNWSGRQTAEPAATVVPEVEADFVDVVKQARASGLSVRATGSSHSHSRVAAPDGTILVQTHQWAGVVAADPADPADSDRSEGGVARVRSGTTIQQIGEPLYRLGYGLFNQGDIDRQSLAGAIATGTHGTGPTLTNFSAQVAAVTLVTGGGDLVRCSASEEPELFEVARQSLGAVGLLTEIELRVRSRYLLRERQWLGGWDDVMGRITDHVDATRHFEFFWVPGRDLFACKSLDIVDPSVAGYPGPADPADPADDTAPVVVSKRERVGWSHRIFPSERNDRHTEMEYSVAAEDGPDCFNELREMVHSRFPELEWPLEYRTVAADDLIISAAGGRPTVTISLHQDVTLDDRPLFSAAEDIFRRYGGRPHWGKVHYQSGAELAALYPDFRRWWSLRDRYDPDSVFESPYLRSLRP
jgi:FAD/FMN-containing dehydrogenase